MDNKAIDDYINKFESYLKQLDKAESDDVTEFYREYLIDAKLDSTAAIFDKLGTPKHLARKILADYSIKMSEENYQNVGDGRLSGNEKVKRNVAMIGVIILALLASPVWIPVAIGLIGLAIFFVLMGIFLVLLFLFLVAASVVMGIVLIVMGLAVIFQSFTTTIFYVGVGLAILGLDFILIPLIIAFLQWGFNVIVAFFRWIGKKLISGRKTPAKEEQDNA